MEERYVACLVLHALGDTIGYKNGSWEFPDVDASVRAQHKVMEFIHLGGVNYVPPVGWRVSDDTIMHLKTAETLLEKYETVEEFCDKLVVKYLEALDQFQKETYELRAPGKQLLQSLITLKKGVRWQDLEYNMYAIGSGAAMRCSCIGLVLHGKANRSKLIATAIEASRVTHTAVTGYLGGVVAALFTAYAIENIPIEEWGAKLLDLLTSGKIAEYIKLQKRSFVDYDTDVHQFIDRWSTYLSDKFVDGKIVERRADINFDARSRYYLNFTVHDFPGSNGDDSVIIAYDCLLDAKQNWEKLVIYSMLHSGDTDTTGAIAASWYGALYGYGEVPQKLLKNIEYYDKLVAVGKALV